LKPGRAQYDAGIEACAARKTAEAETALFTDATDATACTSESRSTTGSAACSGHEDDSDEIDGLVQFVPGCSSRPGIKT
jgi:hypothetical protein